MGSSPGKTPPPQDVQLREIAEKAGVLLEYKARSVLDELSLTTVVGQRYRDPVEGKQREIDVVARVRAPNRALLRIGVECANLSGGFVLLTGNDRAAPFGQLDLESPFGSIPETVFDFVDFPFPARVTERVVTAKWEEKNGQRTSRILKADKTQFERKVMQAIAWSVAGQVGVGATNSDWSGQDVFVPVVCTTSELYEVKYVEDHLELCRADAIGFRMITEVDLEGLGKKPIVRLVFVVNVEGLRCVGRSLAEWAGREHP